MKPQPGKAVAFPAFSLPPLSLPSPPRSVGSAFDYLLGRAFHCPAVHLALLLDNFFSGLLYAPYAFKAHTIMANDACERAVSSPPPFLSLCHRCVCESATVSVLRSLAIYRSVSALCDNNALETERGGERRAAIMATATETEATYLDAASLGLRLKKLPESKRKVKRVGGGGGEVRLQLGVSQLFVVQKGNLR